MTSNEIAVMRQALEALEKTLRYHGVMLLSDPPQEAWKYHRVEQTAIEAITSLHQAIDTASQLKEAEKKQTNASEVEPVAWLWELTGEVTTDPDRADGMWQPLYTSRPQRPVAEPHKPLTDEQIIDLWPSLIMHQHTYAFARAIEAAHGIKEEA